MTNTLCCPGYILNKDSTNIITSLLVFIYLLIFEILFYDDSAWSTDKTYKHNAKGSSSDSGQQRNANAKEWVST